MHHPPIDGPYLLLDPIAQRLLQSTLPARFAWTSTNGASMDLAMVFHWDGTSVVFGAPPAEPALHSLTDGDRATVTIDSAEMPSRVLVLDGCVRRDVVDGTAPEYEAAILRCLGEDDGRAWLAEARLRCRQMARVFLEPDRFRILGFRMAFPGGSERAIAQIEGEGSASRREPCHASAPGRSGARGPRTRHPGRT